MTMDDVKFGEDGKPTKESLELAFRDNIKLFHELQDKYMTTKGTMGDNPFKGLLNKLMKGKKDGK